MAAILAMFILTALGVLVFSMSTQDIRTSSRMVGEKKAFTAAEAGVNWLTHNFNAANPSSSAVANPKSAYASTNVDQGSAFTISTPAGPGPGQGPAALPLAGFYLPIGQKRYLAEVTGTNKRHGSSVQLAVGIGYGPVNLSTEHP